MSLLSNKIKQARNTQVATTRATQIIWKGSVPKIIGQKIGRFLEPYQKL